MKFKNCCISKLNSAGPWNGVAIYESWLLPNWSSSVAKSHSNAGKAEVATGMAL